MSGPTGDRINRVDMTHQTTGRLASNGSFLPMTLTCVTLPDANTCAWNTKGTEPTDTCVSFNDNASGCKRADGGVCTWTAQTS